MTLSSRALEAHLQQLEHLIRTRGIRGVRAIYEDARKELQDRLLALKNRPLGSESLELRAMQAQVNAVLSILGRDLHKHLRDVSKTAATLGAQHGLREYKMFAKRFGALVPVMSLDRASVFHGMVAGVDQSLLRRHSAVSASWAASTIAAIERVMANAVMTGKPLHQTVQEVAGRTGVLANEKWKAERIVRTESQYSHGAVKQQTMEQIKQDTGEVLMKRLIEHIDDRTGDDSFIIHGQTVPVNQPFTWKRKVRGSWVTESFMHPPNRPNDRSVVIPWDPKWVASGTEKELSLAELATARPTRWRSKAGVQIPPGHVPGESYRGSRPQPQKTR
jgi:hypothetical protein